MSRGTSTITGPGRPFFRALNARRIAAVVAAGQTKSPNITTAGMSEGQKQDRNTIGKGGGDSGKGVFGPRPILHHEDARRLSIGYPCEPIGHIDPDPFLPADNRTNARSDGVLDQGCGREAKESRYTLSFKDCNDSICGLHPDVPLRSLGGIPA